VLLTLGEAASGLADASVGPVAGVVEGPAGDPEAAFSLVTDECPVRLPPKVPLIRPNASPETTSRAARATASRFRLTFARTSRTR
jgi:hypothetical protein